MKILLFIGGDVGMRVAEWLLNNYRSDIALAVTDTNDPCHDLLKKNGVKTVCYETDNKLTEYIEENNLFFDVGFLIWFGPIMKNPLLGIPEQGFISMHPAYLPYNRGAHFNIYPIVEESPYGVSLFFVNEIEHGIDTGDIVARKPIAYTWEDTGATLRRKGPEALVELFTETYPSLRDVTIPREKQDLSVGTTHYKSELEKASCIDLDKQYTARHLLNWLRARTFPGYPACHFYENGQKYEVRVEIKKVS